MLENHSECSTTIPRLRKYASKVGRQGVCMVWSYGRSVSMMLSGQAELCRRAVWQPPPASLRCSVFYSTNTSPSLAIIFTSRCLYCSPKPSFLPKSKPIGDSKKYSNRSRNNAGPKKHTSTFLEYSELHRAINLSLQSVPCSVLPLKKNIFLAQLLLSKSKVIQVNSSVSFNLPGSTDNLHQRIKHLIILQLKLFLELL